MYTAIEHFDMEMQLTMNTISGMQSKTNNTASTLVIPTQNIYKGVLYLSIINVTTSVYISVLLVIFGWLWWRYCVGSRLKRGGTVKTRKPATLLFYSCWQANKTTLHLLSPSTQTEINAHLISLNYFHSVNRGCIILLGTCLCLHFMWKDNHQLESF
jgi:hypothetical protein